MRFIIPFLLCLNASGFLFEEYMKPEKETPVEIDQLCRSGDSYGEV